MPSFKPSTLVIELVIAELLEIVKLKGASPIVSHNRWFLERRSDVTSWRPLIGPCKSCAVRSEESIGRDFGATRIHGNGQTTLLRESELCFHRKHVFRYSRRDIWKYTYNQGFCRMYLKGYFRQMPWRSLELDFMEETRTAIVLWPF